MKDPLAYQMIQAMNPTVTTLEEEEIDRSDEAEAERYVKEHGELFYAQELGIDYDAVDRDFPVLRDAP